MMYRERSILHFNVADFAVAVERVADTSLKSRPLIIAPLQAARAVVHDMSEEAFQAGVRKGMQLHQAARLCREAAVLPPRFDLYTRAMHDFLRRVNRFSPRIEYGAGDGHLFVDVTGTHRLFGPPPDIGWRVRKEVRSDLGVNPIWSLSSNKLVAKVASRLVKPVGEYIVAPGEEQDFLAPISITLLPGVSLMEQRKLHEFNIFRVGQLAGLTRQQLMVPFGQRGGFLYEASRGIDRENVMHGLHRESSVCCEHHFADDTNDQRQVDTAVAEMTAQAAMELRSRKQAARRITMRIVYSDGTVVVRQASRKMGSSDDYVLREMGLLALRRAWKRRTRLRSCSLACDRLHRQSPQLSLFAAPGPQQGETGGLLSAMDTIRSRFGKKSIRSGLAVSPGTGSPAGGR